MTKRTHAQLIYASTASEKWLQTAIAVAQPSQTALHARQWRSSLQVQPSVPQWLARKRPH